MIEDSKSPSNCCKYCGWEFQNDIIQKIINNKESIVCEFCGIEINNPFTTPKERINKDKFDRNCNSRNYTKKKEKSIIKKISKLIQPRKYSIGVIFGDNDFPRIFKENLIIVISRLIYVFIREWEQNNNLNIGQVSLEKPILYYLIKMIRPICNKRVNNRFLNNLFRINVEDFENWLKMMQNKVFSDQNYHTHFNNFLIWLIKVVFKLVSNMWEMKNLPKFQSTILKDLKDYHFNTDDNPLKINNELEKTNRKQMLYDNKKEQLKECGRCHQILPYNKFFPVSKNSLKVRPYCKKCNSELNLIRQSKKKLKLILYDFNGKCSQCNANILVLPALQFHHQNPQEKTYSWRDICGKSYRNLSDLFKKENVIVLCSNCHLNEQAINFSKNYPLILHETLFQLTPEEINDLVLKFTEKIPKKLDRMHIREKIREWIKKRFVIEQLYKGKCIGCGNTDLVALEFHHINPNIDKKLKWDALELLDTKTIIKQLINQNCLCVCSNCHALIHSRYSEFAEEILESFYSNDEILQKAKLIKKYFGDITDNISNFKIEYKKLNFKPLLLLEIPHFENWKIHLLKIHFFLQKSNSILFKAYDLKNILQISIRHIYKHLNRFINQRYIEKDSTKRGCYKFTVFGLYKIEEIEKNHKSISSKLKKQIQNL